jgi:hypothetical protein
MIGRILCWFCFHKWSYNKPGMGPGVVRTCSRCQRRDTTQYDPCYGDITWRRL